VNHQEWLDRYRQAWVERDAGAAAELFTEDAIYRERPFDPPLSGRDAIRHYWSSVTRTQSSIELQYGSPVIQGGRVAVEWWANLVNDGSPVTLAGEFLLAFDDDGRCRELREYWAVTEGRVEPPSGWGA
jgi:ketosteroid isomerase-like protein